jgi:hypothetical protein
MYPRAWRKRYGDEFALLLDATPMTPRVVANVIGAAAREWILRTLTGRVVLGPVMAYAALLTAQILIGVFPAEPTFSVADGQRLVTPPWPASLGIIQSSIGTAVLLRMVISLWLGIRVGSSEFVYWAVGLFAGAVTQQWAYLLMNAGTGVARWSLWTVWGLSAFGTTLNLGYLLLASKGLPGPDQTPWPYRRSSRPLGLS